MQEEFTPLTNYHSIESSYQQLPPELNTPEHRHVIMEVMKHFGIEGIRAVKAGQQPEFGINTMQNFWADLNEDEVTTRAKLLRALVTNPIGLDVIHQIANELHQRFSAAHKSRDIILKPNDFQKFMTELLSGEHEKVRKGWAKIRNNPTGNDFPPSE